MDTSPSSSMRSRFLGLGLALLVFIGALGLWKSFHAHAQGDVIPFGAARDTEVIVTTFEKDKYWLTANPDYPVRKMLLERTPKEDLAYVGTLDLRVLRDANNFKGFIAFYQESRQVGHVLFLSIPEAFRGQGCGEKLLQESLAVFRQQGPTIARIVTRTNNFPAQHLYKKVGFREVSQKNGFIYYEMALAGEKKP